MADLEAQNITNVQSIGTSSEQNAPKVMSVKKRNGSLEPVDVNKIINVVYACSTGLESVDPMRVATRAISGLYDGASTKELDELCIRTASLLVGRRSSILSISCSINESLY